MLDRPFQVIELVRRDPVQLLLLFQLCCQGLQLRVKLLDLKHLLAFLLFKLLELFILLALLGISLLLALLFNAFLLLHKFLLLLGWTISRQLFFHLADLLLYLLVFLLDLLQLRIVFPFHVSVTLQLVSQICHFLLPNA